MPLLLRVTGGSDEPKVLAAARAAEACSLAAPSGVHTSGGVLMPVFLLLLIGLLSVPLAELYVLIEVGRSVGAGTTIALVILTAVLGAWLLRWQGLSTLARAQKSLNAGELPATELIEGVILLVTGLMLLTPGFITDALGFLLLLPAVRQRAPDRRHGFTQKKDELR